MKNKGKSTITTAPLTQEIEAFVAREIPAAAPQESHTEFQFRREARILQLHFGLQTLLDLFLHNTGDRQLAMKFTREYLKNQAI